MKVLVSTHLTQKQRKNDFCFCRDGEMVYLGFECDGGGVDDSCGCKRSFSGMDCARATTTALVVDVDEDATWFKSVYVSTMERAGWLRGNTDVDPFLQAAQRVLDIANRFKTGDILEKRGDKIQVRSL